MTEYCSVCMCDHEKENTTTLKCKHTFCTSCIDTWCKQHNTCPMCRASIKTKEAFESGLDYTQKFFNDTDFKFTLLATCQHDSRNKEILMQVIKGIEREYKRATDQEDSDMIQICTDHFIDIYNYM